MAEPARTDGLSPGSSHVQQWVRVAGAGYFIVLVFAFGYFWAARSHPSLGGYGHVFVGFLFAGPVGIAFIWHRLGSLRMGPLSFSLHDVTTLQPDEIRAFEGQAEDAIAAEQYFSDPEETKRIVAQLSKKILQSDRTVIEINLHSQPYWWSTRLFLLASILRDDTSIDRIVFTSQGSARQYLGHASPADVVEAMAVKEPSLNEVYHGLKKEGSSLSALITKWAQQASFSEKSESDVKCLLDGRLLEDLLGNRLTRNFVSPDARSNAHLYYRVLAQGERYVPVVAHGRLERVIDADRLARLCAVDALENALARSA